MGEVIALTWPIWSWLLVGLIIAEVAASRLSDVARRGIPDTVDLLEYAFGDIRLLVYVLVASLGPILAAGWAVKFLRSIVFGDRDGRA